MTDAPAACPITVPNPFTGSSRELTAVEISG